MRVAAAILIIGLTLVCVGIAALAAAPPKVVTTVSRVSLPYTSFTTLLPGPHNFTRTFKCGRNATRFSLPGTYQVIATVGSLPKVNCTHGELTLYLGGGGLLTPVKGSFLKVTLSAIVNGKRITLDEVKAPINVSGLAVMGAPIVTTTTPGSGEESEKPPQLETSYEVGSVKGLFRLYVMRSEKDKAEVALTTTTAIHLPTNTSKVILEVSSNAQGGFGASLNVNYVCVITKYLDSPQYLPRVSYTDVTVSDKYLSLGNLPVALTLMVVGLALMNIACYLRSLGRTGVGKPLK